MSLRPHFIISSFAASRLSNDVPLLRNVYFGALLSPDVMLDMVVEIGMRQGVEEVGGVVGGVGGVGVHVK